MRSLAGTKHRQSLSGRRTDPGTWILLVEHLAIWHVDAIGIDFQLIGSNGVLFSWDQYVASNCLKMSDILCE